MKKLIIAGLFVGQHLLSQSLCASNETMTLQDLKEKCRQYEQNSQVVPFTSSFTCSEEKTFYSKTGESTITLDNESNFSIKALIKDGSHNTNWWTISQNPSSQTAHCPVMEQYKATARYTVTVNSCEQLEAIHSEEEFCKEKLEAVWNECNDEMNENPFTMPKSSMCEYERTGKTKTCVESEVPQQEVPQQEVPQQEVPQQEVPHQEVPHQEVPQQEVPQQEVPHQEVPQQEVPHQEVPQQEVPQQEVSQQEDCSSSSVSSSSQSSSLSSSEESEEAIEESHHQGSSHSSSSEKSNSSSLDSSNCQGQESNVQQRNTIELGSQVKMVSVNRGFMHSSHKVVQVMQEPSEGSLLSKMGLHKDNVISRINGVRVRDLSTFVRMLKLAKSQKRVALEYRNSQNTYVTVRVML